MNRYMKLVSFEMNRFMKLYLVLILMTVALQFTAVIVRSLSYVHQANKVIFEQAMTKEQYITTYGLLDFSQICRSAWFLIPIAISATVLLGYVFLIWYRDWFAKNTFIYRLLMLPTSRLTIYFSKATAILLFVLGLVALEMIILPLEISLFEKLVPGGFRADLPLTLVISGFFVLYTIIPGTFTQFVLYYGMGLMFVFILFTGILFERSFGLKGLLAAAFFTAVSIFIFISPIVLLTRLSSSILYPGEFIGLEIALGLIDMATAVLISRFLLMKKITV